MYKKYMTDLQPIIDWARNKGADPSLPLNDNELEEHFRDVRNAGGSGFTGKRERFYRRAFWELEGSGFETTKKTYNLLREARTFEEVRQINIPSSREVGPKRSRRLSAFARERLLEETKEERIMERARQARDVLGKEATEKEIRELVRRGEIS